MSKLYIIASIASITSSQTIRTVTNPSGDDYKVDDTLNRALLDQHNELRNGLALNGLPDTTYNSGDSNQPSDLSHPRATYMNELHYDEGLAILAQEYLNGFKHATNKALDTCSFGHNLDAGADYINNYKSYATFAIDPAASSIPIGENLLWVSRDTSKSVVQQSEEIVKSGWWDEYEMMSYSGEYCWAPQTCGPDDDEACPCGHYTQMAWADTRYIGCGTIECGSNDQVITLCNYYPAGNIGNSDTEGRIVKKPYTEATSSTVCSGCAANAEDRDVCDGTTSGLCSGCQSKYFAYNPTPNPAPAPASTCVDNYSNCATSLISSCPSSSGWACIGGTITCPPNDYCSCSTSWSTGMTCSEARDADPPIPYDQLLNGHLCTGCELSCGVCTPSPTTSPTKSPTRAPTPTCTGDGLDYTEAPTSSPTPAPTSAPTASPGGGSPAKAQGESQAQGYVFEDEDNTVVVTKSADWAIAGMCMICAVCSIILGIGYYLHSRKVAHLKMELKSQKLMNNEENQSNINESEHSETIDGHGATIDMTVNIEERGESVEAEAIIDETAQ